MSLSAVYLFTVLRFVHESRYEEMVAAMKDEAAKAKQVTNDGLLVRSTYMGPGNRHVGRHFGGRLN